MYKSKLVKYYNSLNSLELEKLRKWVNSPFHNKHVEVQKLFEFLFSRQSISALSTDKKRAFKYLYGKKDFDDLRLRHMMSLAVNVLEDFVRFSHPKSKYTSLNLLYFCKEKGLKNLYVQNAKKILASLSAFDKMTPEEHGFAAELCLLIEQYPAEIKTNQLENFQVHWNFEHQIKALMNADRLLPEDMMAMMTKEVIKTNQKQSIVFRAAYIFYQNQIGQLNLNALTDQLFTLLEALPIETQQELFTKIESNLVSQAISEDQLTLLFKWCQKISDLDVFSKSKLLDERLYNQIVTLGLYHDQHIWVADFVNRYTKKIGSALSAEMNRLTRARLLFAKSSFKAAQLLLKKNFKYNQFQSRANIMIAKILYVTGDNEALGDYLGQCMKSIDRAYFAEDFNFLKALYMLSKAKDSKAKALQIEKSKQLTLSLQDHLWFESMR